MDNVELLDQLPKENRNAWVVQRIKGKKMHIYLHVYTGFCPSLFRMETRFMPQELEIAHFGCHHPHELRAGPCGLLFRLKCIGRFLASLVSGCAFSCLRIFPVDSTHRLTGLQGLKRLKALGDEPILLQDILQLLHFLKWPMPLQEQSEKSCGRGDL